MILRPFAHEVAYCCVLLGVVTQSLKPVKFFSQQLPTFLTFRDRRCACVTRLDPFAQLFPTLLGSSKRITHGLQSLMGVSFPSCTEGPNNIGISCIRLHTTANTDATTPNIVGPTILGFLASVCKSLQTRT